MKKLLSVVIPVYNEAANLSWHHEKIRKHLSGIGLRHEIIYVDDGSSDDSISQIKKIAKKDAATRYAKLSRNFGKEAATSAGLKLSKGDAVLIIDADGQHPIEMLPNFLKKWNDGAEVVVGVRTANNKEGAIKRYGSKLFYFILDKLTIGEIVPSSTDFRLIDRKVVDEFNMLTERNRITRGLVDWLGFNRDYVKFKAHARHAGDATYSYKKLLKLALHSFVSQSTKPLKFVGSLGIAVSCSSLLLGTVLGVQKYALGDPLNTNISGTALLAIFLSFLVGIVLVCQGLMALYVESIYHESQNRPLFVISEEG